MKNSMLTNLSERRNLPKLMKEEKDDMNRLVSMKEV